MQSVTCKFSLKEYCLRRVGIRWLVVEVGMMRRSCWKAAEFASVNCLRGWIGIWVGLAERF